MRSSPGSGPEPRDMKAPVGRHARLSSRRGGAMAWRSRPRAQPRRGFPGSDNLPCPGRPWGLRYQAWPGHLSRSAPRGTGLGDDGGGGMAGLQRHVTLLEAVGPACPRGIRGEGGFSAHWATPLQIQFPAGPESRAAVRPRGRCVRQGFCALVASAASPQVRLGMGSPSSRGWSPGFSAPHLCPSLSLRLQVYRWAGGRRAAWGRPQEAPR